MVFLLKDEPKWSFSTWGNSQSYGLITPLRMSYEDSYAKAFPFDKIIDGMLDPEMIEDTVKIVNEAIKDKIQVNLIINNRAGGNAPPDRPEDRRPAPFGEAAEVILNPSFSIGA